MNNSQPASRLKLRFASHAYKAVILRRGPTVWVRQILWNTQTDEFVLGQWLHGSIRSFDLSPSGHYLLTQVEHQNQKPYLWNALSRPPYFTALAMWTGAGIFSGHFPEEGVIHFLGSTQKLKLVDGFVLKNHRVIGDDELKSNYSHFYWFAQPQNRKKPIRCLNQRAFRIFTPRNPPFVLNIPRKNGRYFGVRSK